MRCSLLLIHLRHFFWSRNMKAPLGVCLYVRPGQCGPCSVWCCNTFIPGKHLLEIKVLIALSDSLKCSTEKHVAPHLVWEVSPVVGETETSEGSPHCILTVQQLYSFTWLWLKMSAHLESNSSQWLSVRCTLWNMLNKLSSTNLREDS